MKKEIWKLLVDASMDGFDVVIRLRGEAGGVRAGVKLGKNGIEAGAMCNFRESTSDWKKAVQKWRGLCEQLEAKP